MGVRIGKNGLLGLAALAVVALLAWAWVDGGKLPLRAISEPVTIPGVSQ